MGNKQCKATAASTISNEHIESDEKNEEEDNEELEHQQISVLIIGAGMRGQTYAKYAKDFPQRMKVVCVAEPIIHRRIMMQKLYKIDESRVYCDWKDAAAQEKFADAAVISTLDNLHKDPCIAFANRGYHILLEKPMAPTLHECEEIVAACKSNDIILAVGHVMRYKPHYLKVKELLESGKIGDIVNINHMEPVGWYHFAHSFVRGNWRCEKESGFSLLTKCCHDIDLINSFMTGSKCVAVSSFGSLSHFKKNEKPPGSGDRCIDCSIETQCPYSAVKLYLNPLKVGFPNSFSFVVADVPVPEEIEEKLRTGPYGRCVYECDNDVMSNQVVNMIYNKGQTVSFSMVAFTEKMCVRQTTIFGTKGEMICNENSDITVFDFATKKRETFAKERMPDELTTMSGHGFADYHLMRAFVKAVATNDPNVILSGPDDTLESHRLVFLAEKSRIDKCVITVN